MPLSDAEQSASTSNRAAGVVSRWLPYLTHVPVALMTGSGMLLVWMTFGDLPLKMGIPLVVCAGVCALMIARAQAAETIAARYRRESDRDALRRAAHAQIIAAIPDPALLVDAQMSVRAVNQPAVETLGPLETGAPVSFAIRAPQVAEAVRTVLNGGAPVCVTYFEKVPADRWLEANVARMPASRDTGADDTRTADLLIVLRDLTAQQRHERVRSDFIANASHELRTPLASVLGFIETLQGPARNDEPARDRFLEIMATQATRMSRLINDLMSLSRIEQKAHLRPGGAVDIGKTIGQVVDALQPIASENGVVIESAIEEGPQVMRVAGDRDELTQVFQNLIENAIRYGRSGGKVLVEATRLPAGNGTTAHIEVSVRDYGPGIPPEHLPRLTERFYRADTAASRQTGGTGLGLAIVKHILNRHRGTLNVESDVGKGAVFRVRLDAIAPASE